MTIIQVLHFASQKKKGGKERGGKGMKKKRD